MSQTEVNAQEEKLAVSSMTQQNKRKGHVKNDKKSVSFTLTASLVKEKAPTKEQVHQSNLLPAQNPTGANFCCGEKVVAVDWIFTFPSKLWV